MVKKSTKITKRDPTFAVADGLHSAAIHLLRRIRVQDRGSGLSPARLSALSVVVFGGPIKIGDLAAAEQVQAPTMTRLVKALVAEDLVRRVADPADGRATYLSATPKGRRMLEEGRRRRVAYLAKALSFLKQEELATLNKATEILGSLQNLL